MIMDNGDVLHDTQPKNNENFGKTQVDWYVIIAPRHPFIAMVSVFAKFNWAFESEGVNS